MHDFSSWSLNLGRWFGVHLRLHAFFLLFSVFTVYLSSRNPDDIGYGVLCLALLLFCVLAHEAGHCFAAIRAGGRAEQIVVGPFGGLSHPSTTRGPQHELIVALAGPIVNLLLWLGFACILLASGESPWGLLNPLSPQGVTVGPLWLVCVKLLFWLNWLLLLVNLIPAFPMDGGRALQALFWPAVGYHMAVIVVARGAMLTAAGMFIVAWLSHDLLADALLPAWVPLSLMAIFIFFSAKQELVRLAAEPREEEEFFGYDLSKDFDASDAVETPRRDSPGVLQRWWRRRRNARELRRRLLEQDEERRADELLIRVHQNGIDSLSPSERALLERVSSRYRNRHHSR